MASGEGTAITTQPRSKRKEVEQFIRDLDPTEVVEWSTQDVVDKFLQPINMEHMAKDFLANNINGAALIALEESHLKELDCANVGDRISFLEFLKLLKKQKIISNRSRTLWSCTTPVRKLAYHNNCSSYCHHVLCSCCVTTTEWRVTGQGIRWKKGSTGTIKFVDYRFVKDLELRSDTCCCCCVRSELEIYADHKDSVSTHEVKANDGEHQNDLVIRHPEAAKAESIIRNCWAEANLVAE